jgi:hypothetical protein
MVIHGYDHQCTLSQASLSLKNQAKENQLQSSTTMVVAV